MATKRVSVKGVAQQQRRDEKALVQRVKDGEFGYADSFVNFQQNLGIGANNAMSTSGYGFNPITRVRTMLEWIHRGSWLGGVAVDLYADDMTRGGVQIKSKLKPAKIDQIDEAITSLAIWDRINDTIKWSRLYGGAIGVLLIDGQNISTPLRMETVGRGQFKGVVVLDRWMVDPSLSDLITDMGPDLGMPKYYVVNSDGPALHGQKVHYSRVFRMEGVRLPYWQRVMENMWSISVLERLYDRMVAYDSATTGAAQLIYKAYIRTYSIEGLRNLIAAGGKAMTGVVSYVEMMRRFQGIEGITLLDAKDKFEAHSNASFAGLDSALTQLGQQIAGALQIPLVRLFGQSPSGFSTGDTDLRMYYDSIKQKQEAQLMVPVTKIYRLVAQSEGIALPEGFKLAFRSLWQITDKEKAEIANTTVDAVTKAQEAGLVSDQVGMKELQASSEVTGIFTNISEKDINSADDVAVPKAEELGLGLPGEEETSLPESGKGDKADSKPKAGKGGSTPRNAGATPKTKSVKDSIATVANIRRIHGLDVVIENPKGSVRTGKDWQVTMPADYGYIRQTVGADGDQIDCYIGPNHDSQAVFLIHQMKVDDPSQFDEHKVMIGYTELRDAMVDYLAGYHDGLGWERIGKIEALRMDGLKSFIASKLLPV